MIVTRILAALLAAIVLAAAPSSAETVLRIGLNDDPDALDPIPTRSTRPSAAPTSAASYSPRSATSCSTSRRI